MSNTAILDKYSSTSLYLITLKEIKEDFMQIKPINVPVYDILLLNTLGTYINKFSKCSKWKHYENIHVEIIKMLINVYPSLKVNYNEIIQEINILRDNLEPIYKGEFKTFEILDKQYKFQFNIDENYIQNTVNEKELYLDFRISIRSSINKLFQKYKPECNDIDMISENLIESITENFKELETNKEFIISLNLINSVKDKINKKVENVIKEIFLSDINQKEITEIFLSELDKIYKDTIKTEFNFLNEDLLDKIEQIFNVEKEMHKLSFSFENRSHLYKNCLEK